MTAGNPQQRGRAFEIQVASLYEALGYKATHDINLNGHQVDILARKHIPGVGFATLLIEAKHRRGKSVSVADVAKFKTTANDLRQAGEITAAVMVSDLPFSQDAKAAGAKPPSITLLTLHDLEQELFNISESLLKIVADYENEPIFVEYIALAGHQDHRRKGDVVDYLLNWPDAKSRFICVLGDFGVGKTTVLDRLFYEHARRRLADGTQRYPILLRLHKLLSFPDVWTFLLDSLRERQYVAPPRSAVERLLKQDKALLILDGFDEIRTTATVEDRQTYFDTLAPIISLGSPCILSTRPTYFQSIPEIARMLDTAVADGFRPERTPRGDPTLINVLDRLGASPAPLRSRRKFSPNLHIDQLDEASILAFIRKYEAEIRTRLGSTPEAVMEYLFGVYDLRDLMERPLLLKLVIVTLLEGGLSLTDPDVKWGPSILYENYTQYSARRDLKVRKQGLTAPERIATARHMALQMFQKGQLDLSHAEAANAVDAVRGRQLRKISEAARADLLERLVTDVRVCAFLKLRDDNLLRFTHKSFYEFFIAQSIIVESEKDGTFFMRLGSEAFTSEVIYFLACYARHRKVFEKDVRTGLRSGLHYSPAGRSLLRRVAFATDHLLSGGRFDEVTIRDLKMARGRHSDVVLTGTHLERVRIWDVQLDAWALKDIVLDSCHVNRTTWRDSVFDADLRQTDITDMDFEGPAFAITGGTWKVERAKISSATISLNGNGRAAQVHITDCQRLTLGPDLMIRGSSSLEAACALVSSDTVGQWYEVGAAITFSGAKLCGLFIESQDLINALRQAGGKSDRLVLHDCEGVLLTRNLSKTLTSAQRRALRASTPRFYICDLDELGLKSDWRPPTSQKDEALAPPPPDPRRKLEARAELVSALNRFGIGGSVSDRLLDKLEWTDEMAVA